MKVFSIDKWYEDNVECGTPYASKEEILADFSWAKKCEGKEVIDGLCLGMYIVLDEWCIDV